MTVPQIKVKIQRRPVLKLKVLPRFPASVTAESPITLDRTGGNYEFGLDIEAAAESLSPLISSNPGGSNTQLQYNNNGSFGGISGATSNGTTLALTNATGNTQSALDNSTKLATTAYVDRTSRERLTANRTYYVRTDGDNTNTGLADSADGAYLTIQKAYDVVADTLDLAGYVVTIQVGNGTYTAGLITCKGVIGGNGPGSVVIKGSATPSDVVISVTSSDCFGLGETAFGAGTNGLCQITICGMKLQTTTAGNCINVSGGGVGVTLGASGFPIEFGACAQDHMVANHSGWIIAGTNYTVSGGALIHAAAISNSTVAIHNVTVTLSGTPAFTYFAFTDTNGALFASGMTFSGSATGTRYFAGSGGMIYTNGSATYLPGDSAGVEYMGGKYIGSTGPSGLQQYTSGVTDYLTLGTGVATALGVNVGSAGAPVVNGGALGTPSSGTVTNLTGTASININGTVGATTPGTGAFTTLSASGLITATGGQIAFPATQVPSANANTLDDYEEGTWTPAVAFGGASVGITYSTQAGVYTKIGNLVRAACAITLSSKGSSVGNVTISGLPFAHAAFLTTFSPYVTGMTSGVGDTMIMAFIGGGASSFSLAKIATGSAVTLADTDFTNTSTIYINAVYHV